MRIVVLGYIIRGPLGGLCWHYLQYILGLRKLGHVVLFLEDSDNFPSCYNPETNTTIADPSYGINFILNLFKQYDLQENWAYYDEHKNQWLGKSKNEVLDFCKNADIILNISNVSPLREWWAGIPKRVLIDTDPAFTQIRHLTDKKYMTIAESHTHFFSFGENFGKTGCLIPNDGFNWIPTRQPIVLDVWNISPPNPVSAWTTVMQWDSYTVSHYKGISYKMKSASFNDYLGLPKTITDSFELAIGSPSTPDEMLKQAGWKLSNPLSIARTPENFQHYIQQSKGEFSVAKHGYVISNSGWFSERSAGYLASGRPVVVQETGFSQNIETGRGLFAFSSLQEAITAIKEINDNYPNHCRYARELAEEYFNSDRVLKSMLALLNN